MLNEKFRLEITIGELASTLGISRDGIRRFYKGKIVHWEQLESNLGISITLPELIKLIVYVKCNKILKFNFIKEIILEC